MTLLNKLEQAIQEIKLQKDELLENIQAIGWKDDRPIAKIPPESHIVEFPDLLERRVPERAPLPGDARSIYQKWYSAVRTIIAKNQPARIKEIDQIYSKDICGLINDKYLSKEIQFKLMDCINQQFDILAAVPDHLKSSLYDIELTAYSILMDDEISAARHLHLRGFLRPAGALAGVILERHLKLLLDKHDPPIKYSVKAPISTLNDLCKDGNIYDLIEWRKIQHLADLRNLCDHDREREPTEQEVMELINGVSSILKKHNL